jgi:hypothetical protein
MGARRRPEPTRAEQRREEADVAHRGTRTSAGHRRGEIQGAVGETGWPSDLLAFMEMAFGGSLEDVQLRVSADADADAAQAWTTGNEIVVAPGAFSSDSHEGRELIAHEVAHLTQRRRGRGTSQDGGAERDADRIAARVARTGEAGVSLSSGPTTQSERRYKRDMNLVRQRLQDACTGLGTDEEAIVTTLSSLNPIELREIRSDAGLVALLQSELSLWDEAQVMDLLGGSASAANIPTMSEADARELTSQPNDWSFGEVAGAETQRMMLEHQREVAATGVGTLHGNQAPAPAPKGATLADCTTLVLDVLERTFRSSNQGQVWERVRAQAMKDSTGGLEGTALQAALQAQAGWKGVFFSPDPRNPEDKTSEHPVAWRQVRETGTSYGVNVDPERSVINYRRTSSESETDRSGLDRLARVPFGVISARGGRHMALLVGGVVYEIHWDLPASDRNVMEATPLEQWAWQSGIIVAPAADLDRAWGS